jgi:excisionase family DNA binding protein
VRHDDYTTVAAAAKRFGLSARHLRRLLQQGVIEGIKPGRDWLVRPSAVGEYLRRGVKPGPKPRRLEVES